MALLYAAIFFLIDFFPTLISTADRSAQFGAIVHWLPGTIAISVALFLAVAITNPRLSPRAAAAIAIIFEVAAGYGIAAAELLQPLDYLRDATWIGLSWVAVWTLLFTIAILSTAAVAVGGTRHIQQRARDGGRVVRGVPASRAARTLGVLHRLCLSVPVVVGMAYVGARVLFALGREVQKARELGSYRLLRAPRSGRDGRGLARTPSALAL